MALAEIDEQLGAYCSDQKGDDGPEVLMHRLAFC